MANTYVGDKFNQEDIDKVADFEARSDPKNQVREQRRARKRRRNARQQSRALYQRRDLGLMTARVLTAAAF